MRRKLIIGAVATGWCLYWILVIAYGFLAIWSMGQVGRGHYWWLFSWLPIVIIILAFVLTCAWVAARWFIGALVDETTNIAKERRWIE
jgi:hypothetical protein